MIDDIKAVTADISAIELALAKSLSFFRTEGKVFLVTDNKFKDNCLAESFITNCKMKLNFQDIKNLTPLYELYLVSARNLAYLMEIDISRNKYFQQSGPLSTPELLNNFVNLRQAVQGLLVEFYSYFLELYTLKTIPPPIVQTLIAQDPSSYDLTATQADLSIDVKDLTSSGKPDLRKFSERENQSSNLAIQISVASEMIAKVEFLEEWFAEEFTNFYLKEIIENALEDIYSEIYTFVYQQLNQGRIPLAEVLQNVQVKFPEIKNALLISIKRKRTELDEFLGEEEKAELQEVFAEVLDYLTENASAQTIINYEQLKIYKLSIRPRNSFESATFKSVLSVDCYDYRLEQVLLSTLTLAVAPQVYDYVADIYFEEEHNAQFNDDLLSQSSFSPSERLDLEEQKYADTFAPDDLEIPAEIKTSLDDLLAD